jgi:DNA-binding response OmpR family regulator
VPIPDPTSVSGKRRLNVRPKVLICDNEDALRALVRGALSMSDYELAEARDGDESLEVAREFEPDLIVLDLMMPGRTGFEVLEELRLDARFAETPVVLLTARTQAADREAADSAGADRFLPKPFSPLELVSIVEELLQRRSVA